MLIGLVKREEIKPNALPLKICSVPKFLYSGIKIGKKLIGSFIGIVIIMIIIGIVGFFGTTSIDSRLTHMYDDQLLPTDVLETMDGDVWELRGDVYKYLSIEKDRSKTKQSIDAITSRLDESIKGYEKEVVSDEEKGVYKNLVDAWENITLLLMQE